MAASIILRRGAVIGVGHAASAALVFGRNIAIARLLGPEQFGIGAALATTGALIEASTNANADKLLIQARDGDDPELQRAAQFVQLVRGVLGAILMLALAKPAALLFGMPQATWAFAAFALVPLVGGFRNLDSKRFQRQLRFGPDIAVELLHQTAGLVVGVLLAWYWRHYGAVLGALLAQWVVWMLASNLVAERPLAVSARRAEIMRILSFGWPLVLNSIAMYLVSQGDRLLVAQGFGASDLGIYAVAAGLAMLPILVLVRAVGGPLLPMFAAFQDHPAVLAKRARIAGRVLPLIALGGIAPLAIGNEDLIVLLYGQSYRDAAGLLPWLATAQVVLMARSGPTTLALARGDGQASLLANLCRLSSLVAAVAVIAGGGGLIPVAGTALAGELLAVLVAARRSSVACVGRGVIWMWPVALALGGLALFYLAAGVIGSGHLYTRLGIRAGLYLALAVLPLLLLNWSDLRSWMPLVLPKMARA